MSLQRLGLVLAAILAAPNARANDLDGVWTGSYYCQQGPTTLDLFVTTTPAGTLLALFHFGDGGISRPEGCFAMRGALANGQMTFTAGKWLLRPYGYVGVDLSGTVHGNTYAGLVAGPGCTAFTLTWGPPAPAPSACRERDAPIS